MSEQPRTGRRGFLLGLTAGVPLLVAGGFAPGLVSPAMAALPVRQVILNHRHTGETVRTPYYADGRYLEDGLKQINRFMRDWRTDEIIEIDPRVLDIVFMLQQQLKTSGPMEVLSGYRSPETNSMLRRRSRGVAQNSLHMYGMAVDLYFPGIDVSQANKAALGLQAGGVGFYPGSNFVHVDSGPIRHWMQRGRVTAGKDGGVPSNFKRGVSSSGNRRTQARIARQVSTAKSKSQAAKVR
jgi:uncharacterized protein YcbK (DUF882 family)